MNEKINMNTSGTGYESEVFPHAYRVGMLFMEGLRPYARSEKINTDAKVREARSRVILYLKGLEAELESLDRKLSMKKGLSLYLARTERNERVISSGGTPDDENDESSAVQEYDDAEDVEKSSNGVSLGSVMDEFYSSGSFSDELYDIMKKTGSVISILEKGELSVSDAEKAIYDLGIITQKSAQETLSSLGMTVPSDEPKTFSALKDFMEGVDGEIKDDPYVILRRMLMSLGSNTLELLDQDFEYDVSRGMRTNAPRIFSGTDGLRTRKGFSQYVQNVLSSEYECSSARDSRHFMRAMSFLFDGNGRFREKYSAVDPRYRSACGKYIREFYGSDLRNLKDYDSLMEKESGKGFDFMLSDHINSERMASDGKNDYFRIPRAMTDGKASGIESYCRDLYFCAQAGKLSQNARNGFFKGAEAVMLSRREKGRDSFQVPPGFENQDFSFSSVVSDLLVPNAGRSLIDAVNYYCQLLKMESYLKGLPLGMGTGGEDKEFKKKAEMKLRGIQEEKVLIGQDIDRYLSSHSKEDIRKEVSDALGRCHYPLTKWIDVSMAPNLRKMIFSLAESIQSRNTEDFRYLQDIYLPYCQNNRDTYRKIFFEPFFTILETADLRTKKGRQDASIMTDELVNRMLEAGEYDKGVYIGELYGFPSFRKTMDALVSVNEKAEKEKLLEKVCEGYDMMTESYEALKAPLYHDEEDKSHLTISDIYNDSVLCVNVSAVYLIRELTEKALPEKYRQDTEANRAAAGLFYARIAGSLSESRYREAVSNLEQTRNARGQMRASYDSSTISFYLNGAGAGDDGKSTESDGKGAFFRITSAGILRALGENDARFSDMGDLMRMVETGSMSMKDAALWLDSRVTEDAMKERALARSVMIHQMDPKVQYRAVSDLYAECFRTGDRQRFESECGILEDNNPFMTKERMLKAFDTGNPRAFLSMLFTSPDGMATVMGRKDIAPEDFLDSGNPLVRRLLAADEEYVSTLKGEAEKAYDARAYELDIMTPDARESFYAHYLAAYRVFSPQSLYCLRNFSGMSVEDALKESTNARNAIEYMSNVVARDVELFVNLASMLDAETGFTAKAKETANRMSRDEMNQPVYPKIPVVRGLSRALSPTDPLLEEMRKKASDSSLRRISLEAEIASPLDDSMGYSVRKGSDLRNTYTPAKGKTIDFFRGKSDLKPVRSAGDLLTEYTKQVEKTVKGRPDPKDRKMQEIVLQVERVKKSRQRT